MNLKDKRNKVEPAMHSHLAHRQRFCRNFDVLWQVLISILHLDVHWPDRIFIDLTRDNEFVFDCKEVPRSEGSILV
jgi:hypothetical protein